MILPIRPLDSTRELLRSNVGRSCSLRFAGLVPRVGSAILFAALGTAAQSAALSPPMLDISRQCGVNSGRNTTAMSECVVAESEARSEVLQGWSKIDDAQAERCIKVSRKAKRLPYSALSKCITATVGVKEGQPAPGPSNAQK